MWSRIFSTNRAPPKGVLTKSSQLSETLLDRAYSSLHVYQPRTSELRGLSLSLVPSLRPEALLRALFLCQPASYPSQFDICALLLGHDPNL